MHILQTPQGVAALRDLGVRIPEDIDRVQRIPIDQAKALLTELKARVKHSFRKFAIELHPDKNGGDAAKTERFKLLVQVRDAFEKMDVQARPTCVPIYQSPVVRVQNMGGATVSFYGDPFRGCTTTSTAGPSVAWRVVRMRPF